MRPRARFASATLFSLLVLPRAGAAQQQQTDVASPAQGRPGSEGMAVHASLTRGIGISTGDGRFGLDVGVMSRIRHTAAITDGSLTRNSFDIIMARPYLRVRGLDDTVRLFAQFEVAGAAGGRLLDLELTWQPSPLIALKAGQFITPFTRGFLTPAPHRQFPNVSPVNTYFRSGRDVGLMAFGATRGGLLEYYLGGFNGNGINRGGNDNTSLLGVARVAINPLRPMRYDEVPSLTAEPGVGLALGLDATVNRLTPTVTTTNPMTGMTTTAPGVPEDRLTLGADVFFTWHRAALLSEFFLREVWRDDGGRARAFGAYVQASAFVLPRRLELAARGGWLSPDLAASNNARWSLDGLASVYLFGQHLKGQLMYTYSRDEARTANPSVHTIITQLQLWI